MKEQMCRPRSPRCARFQELRVSSPRAELAEQFMKAFNERLEQKKTGPDPGAFLNDPRSEE